LNCGSFKPFILKQQEAKREDIWGGSDVWDCPML
jgi:hypothetical protein